MIYCVAGCTSYSLQAHGYTYSTHCNTHRMISKELLLERISAHNLPAQELTIEVEGALYQIFSRHVEIVNTLRDNIEKIIPENLRLFYVSDTSYSLPTQQYSLSLVVR